MVNILTYGRNIAKSITYSAIDITRQELEFSGDFIETNKDLFVEAYAIAKDIKGTAFKASTAIKQSKVYEAAEVGFKAIIEDIKSGKFYNKEREDEFAIKYSGDMGDYSDMDPDNFSTTNTNVDIATGDKMISDSILTSSKSSSEAISNTILRTGSAISKSNQAGVMALYNQNFKLMSSLGNVIGGVGTAAVTEAKKTNSIFATHAENSKTFFEVNTKISQENNAILKEMLQIQRELYKPEKKEEKKRIGIDDIAPNGTPNLREYGKNIARNISNKIANSGGEMILGDAFGEGTNMLAQLVASPLKFIPELIIQSLIPHTLKNVAKDFDKTLSGVFTTMIGRLNNWAKDDNDNPVTKFIGEILGVKVKRKTSIDTARYNKTAVPFDGVTKKAITDVIPGYLARIESAITKSPEKLFNYGSGKWTDRKTLTDQHDTEMKNTMMSAFSDLRDELRPMFDSITEKSYDNQEAFLKEMDNIFKHMYQNYGILNVNTKSNADTPSGIEGVSDETYRKFANAMKRTKNGTKMQLSKNVMDAMANEQRRMQNYEDGLNPYWALYDNSAAMSNIKVDEKSKIVKYAKPIGILTEDKDGRNIFFYLKELLNNVDYIRAYGAGSETSGSGKRRKGSPTNLPTYDTNRSFKDTIRYTEEDKYRESEKRKEIRYEEKVAKLIASGKVRGLDGVDDDSAFNIEDTFNEVEIKQKRDQSKLEKELDESGFRGATRSFFLLDEKIKEGQETKRGDLKKSKNKNPSIFDQLLEAPSLIDKFNIIRGATQDLATMPITMFEHIIANADQKIYDFIYGADTHTVDEDGRPVYGFMNMMIKETKQSFADLNTFLNNDILEPLKEKLGIHKATDISDKILGLFGTDTEKLIEQFKGFFKPLKDEIKNTFGGAMDYARDSVISVYSPVIERITGNKPMMAQESRIKKYKTQQELLMATPADEIKKKIYDTKYQEVYDKWFKTYSDSGKYDMNEIDKKIRETAAAETEKEYMSEYMLRQKQELLRGIKQRDIKNTEKANGISFADAIKAEQDQKAKLTIPDIEEDIPEFAKGARYIAKGGITAISPGELIVPSELNPFNPNRGSVDKDSEIANEKKIKSDLSKSISNIILQNAESKENIDSNGNKVNFMGEMSQAMKSGMNSINDNFGLVKDGDKEKLTQVMQKSMANIKEIGPHAIATGLLGGGVGLLTGIIGGPLIGAAVGAAAGIVQRSESLQNWLFGEQTDDGKSRKGGKLLSQDSYETITKYVPSIAKWGIAGAATGLFTPLGPIGGLLMGSAIGFAKKNDELNELLFGDENGLLNKNRKEAISKAAPNIAIGTISTMLLGPFGLFGNAVLGAGLGLASTTDGFKTALFGEEDDNGKRNGGLFGTIKIAVVDPLKNFAKDTSDSLKDFVKNDLINPLRDAIKPVTTEIGHITKTVLMALPNTLNWIFEKSMGVPLNEWLSEKIIEPASKITKMVFGALVKPVKMIVSAPFKFIGGVGNMFRNKQIKQGRAGGYTTAGERLDFRDDHRVLGALSNVIPGFGMGKDKFKEADMAIDSMDSSQLQNAIDSFQAIKTGADRGAISKLVSNNRGAIAKSINGKFKDNVIGGSRNRILKAIKAGDFNKATKLIATLKSRDGKPLREAEREDLMEDVRKLMGEKQQIEDNVDLYQKMLPDAKKNLGKLGFTSFRGKDINGYLAMLKNEKSHKDKLFGNANKENYSPEQLAAKMLQESNKTQTDRLVEELQNIAKIAISINSATKIQLEGTYGEGLRDLQSRQAADLNSKMAGVDKISDKYGAKSANRIKSRMADLLKKGYKEDQLKSINISMGDKDSPIYELAEYASSKGFSFDNFEGLEDLNNSGVLDSTTIKRIKILLKYSKVPVSSIVEISKMTESEYGNVIKFAKAGMDYFAGGEEGKFGSSFGKIARVKDTRYKFRDKSNKGFFGKAAAAPGKILGGAFGLAGKIGLNLGKPIGLTRKTETEYIMEFQKAGLLDDGKITIDDVLAMSNRQRDIMLKNPESAKTENTTTYKNGIGGFIGRQVGKVRRAFDGTTLKSHDEKKAEYADNKGKTKQSKIFEKLSHSLGFIEKIFQNQEEEKKKEKKSLFSKFWDIGKKFIVGALALAGVPLLYTFVTEKIWPYLKNDIWGKHLEPWWDKSAKPFLLEKVVDPISGFLKKIYDGITNDLPLAIGKLGGTIVNWWSGNTDSGGFPQLLGTATGMLGQAFETVIGVWLPAVTTTLIKTLPTLLSGVVKGLGLFFKTTMSSLYQSNGRKVDISDDGTEELNSVANIDGASTPSGGLFKGISAGASTWAQKLATGFNSTKSSAFNTKSESLDFNSKNIAYKVDDGSWLGESVDKREKKSMTTQKAFAFDGEKTLGESLLSAAARVGITGDALPIIRAIADPKSLKFTKGAIKLAGNIPLAGMPIKAVGYGTTKLAEGLDSVANLGARRFAPKMSKAQSKGLQTMMNDITAKGGAEAGEKFSRMISSQGAEAVLTKGAKTIGEELAETGAESVIKKSLMSKLPDLINKAIKAVFKNSTVVDYFKIGLKKGGKVVNQALVEQMAKEAGEKLAAKVMPLALKGLAKSTGLAAGKIAASLSTGGTLTIAFMVGDFVSGVLDSQSIMGYTSKFKDKITWVEKLGCGVISFLTGLVADLIPEDVIMDLCINILGPMFGIDTSAVQERQRQSVEEVSIYNEEHGTKFTSAREFNKRNSIGSKMGRWFSGEKVDEYGRVTQDSKGSYDKAGKLIEGSKGTSSPKDLLMTTLKDFTDNTLGLAKEAWNGDFKAIVKPIKLNGTNHLVNAINMGLIMVTKTLTTPIAVASYGIGAIVRNIGTILSDIGTVIKNNFNTSVDIMADAWNGDLAGVLARPDNLKKGSNGFTDVISGITSTITRVLMTGPAVLVAGIGVVVRNIETILSDVGAITKNSITGVSSMVMAAYNGNIGEIFSKPDNLKKGSNGFVDVISTLLMTSSKIAMSPVAIIAAAVGAVVRPINKIIDSFKKQADFIITPIFTKRMDDVKGGNLSAFGDYWKNENKDENGKEAEGLNSFGKIGNFAYKIGMAIPTLIQGIGAALGKVFDDMVTDSGWDMEKDKKLVENARLGKINIFDFKGEYWRDSSDKNNTGFMATMGKMSSFIYKLGNSFGLVFENLWKMLQETFFGIWDKIKNGFKGMFEDTTTDETMKAANEKAITQDNVSTPASGTGKSHISQRDPNIANMRFNAPGDTTYQTMKDSGCGPVAASTVVNHYNNYLSPTNAANYALNNGFKEKNGGTNPSYFNSVLSNYGIATKSTNDKNMIQGNLANGKPVIFMGADASNSGSTPFGSSQHYVVGTKMDSKGNVIIQDPDARTGNKKYKLNSLLSKTSTNILTNAGMGKIKLARYGMGGGFGSLQNPDITDAEYSEYSETMCYLDLTYFTPMTKYDMLNYAACFGENATNCVLAKNAEHFLSASATYHIDPRILFALAALESAWGTSNIAVAQNNFFGINANGDRSPTSFATVRDGIFAGAKLLKERYYNVGQRTLYEMQFKDPNHIYCPTIQKKGDWKWIRGIVSIAKRAKMSMPGDLKYINPGNPMGPKEFNATEFVSGITSDIKNAKKTAANIIMNPSEVFKNLPSYIPKVVSGVKNTMSGIDKRFNITEQINSTEASSRNITTPLDEEGNANIPESKKIKKQTIWDVFGDMAKNAIKGIFGEEIVTSMYGEDALKSSNAPTEAGTPELDFNPDTGSYSTNAESPDSFFSTTPGFVGRNNSNPYNTKNDALYHGDRHTGVDYSFMSGSSILSPVDGVVDTVGHTTSSPKENPWGNFVLLRDNGGYYHMFAHFKSVSVSVGQKIHRGDKLGIVGATGNAFGEHLHYEVRTGTQYKTDINPDLYNIKTLSRIDTAKQPPNTGKGKMQTAPMFKSVDMEEAAAKKVLNTKNHSGGGGPEAMSTVDYTRFILTIIEMLKIIADNTDKLNNIAEILSSKLNIEGINTASSGGKGNSESASDKVKKLQRDLLRSIPRSNFNGDSRYKEIASQQDTDFIMNAISALARE